MSPRSSWRRLAVCLALGAGVWFWPPPPGLDPGAWHTFAVFIGVIAGFLLRPLDMAPTVLLGLMVLLATGTAGIDDVVRDGFGNSTVWLVVAAFLLAGAVERTGLGRRIALGLIRRLGRSLLGLGYAIAATELLLGPFVPSNTARGGGIVSPVVRSLARAIEPQPGGSRSAGAYLVQVGAHANLVASAMFLTAMAGNVIVARLAEDFLSGSDAVPPWTFGAWLTGSAVPGLVAMALVPLTVRVLEPAARGDARRAHAQAVEDLEALGAWTAREVVLAAVLLGLLGLWVSKPLHGIDTTTVALFGILVLVVSGAQGWREIAGHWRAWDALVWLGGFVALAEVLKEKGFVDWFAGLLEAPLSGGDPIAMMVLLALIYFFSMYFFSQLTAHITALAGVFLGLAATVSAPPLLALALVSYFSNLCGLTTPWSSGPVIIYFGFDYVSVGRWMRNGFCASIVQIATWLGIGLAWWRFLGWW